MSTTQRGKVVSTQDKEPTALDRFFEPHKVLGVDAEGRVHHYHAAYGREFTFESDGGRIYVVGDAGLEHVEDLGENDVHKWIEFIDEDVCDWDDMRMLPTPVSDLEAAGLGGGNE